MTTICPQLTGMFLGQAAGPGSTTAASSAGASSTGMLGYDLLAVFVFALFGIVFVVAVVSIVGRLLRPSATPASEPAKAETYECGEPAIGSSWVRFDIRFYTVALIFLIFDVEVAFLFPWAAIFKSLRLDGLGGFLLLEMLVFIAILLVGFIYCWSKGDLDWIKSLDSQARRRRAAARTSGEAESGKKEEAVTVS
jgi:NADH-quinone oxidoreductase subunit A